MVFIGFYRIFATIKFLESFRCRGVVGESTWGVPHRFPWDYGGGAGKNPIKTIGFLGSFGDFLVKKLKNKTFFCEPKAY